MLRGKYRSTFVTAWIGLKILKQGVAIVSVEDLFLLSYQSLYIRTSDQPRGLVASLSDY